MAAMLKDKVALVTGGSAGIGRSAALAFAREGAIVVVADVRADGGEETVALVNEVGSDAAFICTDVSESKDVKEMIAKTVLTFGRLDCAFNNAGFDGGPLHPFTDFPDELWDSVINTNLKGVWLCMKHEILQMRKQGSGTIVNNASVLGMVGSPNNPAYTASKHGVVGLTKSGALACARENIRVNAVCPAFIQTPPVLSKLSEDPELEKNIVSRHPIWRLGTPEEIAEAVVWLCSDAASFVTGHSLVLDGGYIAQ